MTDSISCDVCGDKTDDSEIEVIPDERAVCGDCARAWQEACERYVQEHVDVFNDVDNLFHEIRGIDNDEE